MTSNAKKEKLVEMVEAAHHDEWYSQSQERTESHQDLIDTIGTTDGLFVLHEILQEWYFEHV